MYLVWLDGEDPDDGILWNWNDPKSAAASHIDAHVLPRWGDLDCPRKVLVHVQMHDSDEPVETFEFDIEVVPQRGHGKQIDLRSDAQAYTPDPEQSIDSCTATTGNT